jgi:hypothetical protein
MNRILKAVSYLCFVSAGISLVIGIDSLRRAWRGDAIMGFAIAAGLFLAGIILRRCKTNSIETPESQNEWIIL